MGGTEHPYEKPLSMLTRLILNHTNEGDMILDPFMGSGSTGVACVATNRGFTGVEIERSHYETALERLRYK